MSLVPPPPGSRGQGVHLPALRRVLQERPRQVPGLPNGAAVMCETCTEIFDLDLAPEWDDFANTTEEDLV